MKNIKMPKNRHTKTLSSALDDYIAACRRRNLRPQTIRNIKTFRNWLINKTGDMPVKKLNAGHARKIYGVNTERFKRLRTFCRWMTIRNIIGKDPTNGIMEPAIIHDKKPAKYLSPDDAERIRKAISTAPIRFRCAFICSLYAGIRPTEVCRMRWEHINMKERSIYLPAEVTKTRRPRRIDNLPAKLWVMLEKHRHDFGFQDQLHGHPKAGHNPKNTLIPMAPDNRPNIAIWTTERRILSGLAKVDLSTNIFRHTFATYMTALTGNPALAARSLGHSSLSMLQKHYDGIAALSAAEKFFGCSRKEYFAKIFGISSPSVS
jgi:integrase